MKEMIVHHGRQGVVGGGHRVHVASEVEIDRFKGSGLGVPSTRSASFDAKGGSHGGLTYCGGCCSTKVMHSLGEADRGGGLAFPKGSGCHGSDKDVLGGRALVESRDSFKFDFGDEFAVRLEEVRSDPHECCDIRDWPQSG